MARLQLEDGSTGGPPAGDGGAQAVQDASQPVKKTPQQKAAETRKRHREEAEEKQKKDAERVLGMLACYSL